MLPATLQRDPGHDCSAWRGVAWSPVSTVGCVPSLAVLSPPWSGLFDALVGPRAQVCNGSVRLDPSTCPRVYVPTRRVEVLTGPAVADL